MKRFQISRLRLGGSNKESPGRSMGSEKSKMLDGRNERMIFFPQKQGSTVCAWTGNLIYFFLPPASFFFDNVLCELMFV